MSRAYGTRKERAARLLDLVKKGPSFSKGIWEGAFTEEKAAEQYKRWSESWVLGLVKELVPELKKRESSEEKR